MRVEDACWGVVTGVSALYAWVMAMVIKGVGGLEHERVEVYFSWV